MAEKKRLNEIKICFAASSGGHYEQLLMLKPLMEKYQSYVITEKTKYSSENGFKTYKVAQINRKEFLFPIKLIGNGMKSLFILLKEKPDVIISTGVLAMLPTIILGRKMKKKIIYLESFAKVTSATESGKFLYGKADRFYVQWESMLDIYPEAIYKGGIY
ncbi:MAG: PssD/Cps14F family polysaccharide biosynthesis glycosyltransferase [Lachnospiraceae bacterium]